MWPSVVCQDPCVLLWCSHEIYLLICVAYVPLTWAYACHSSPIQDIIFCHIAHCGRQHTLHPDNLMFDGYRDPSAWDPREPFQVIVDYTKLDWPIDWSRRSQISCAPIHSTPTITFWYKVMGYLTKCFERYFQALAVSGTEISVLRNFMDMVLI